MVVSERDDRPRLAPDGKGTSASLGFACSHARAPQYAKLALAVCLVLDEVLVGKSLSSVLRSSCQTVSS